MTAVGRKSFEIYVDGMKKMPKSPERNKNLEIQCQFFMIKRTHVRSEVRDEAKLYLHSLLSKNAYEIYFLSSPEKTKLYFIVFHIYSVVQ
jgi:hypothetical protein